MKKISLFLAAIFVFCVIAVWATAGTVEGAEAIKLYFNPKTGMFLGAELPKAGKFIFIPWEDWLPAYKNPDHFKQFPWAQSIHIRFHHKRGSICTVELWGTYYLCDH